MSEFVRIIASKLIDNVDKMQIESDVVDDTEIITLKVTQSDMGKIIGKKGKIATSIRNVLKSVGIREDRFIKLKILELETGRECKIEEFDID